jgi:CubicO group peptidase (beta-lactamase class C family)
MWEGSQIMKFRWLTWVVYGLLAVVCGCQRASEEKAAKTSPSRDRFDHIQLVEKGLRPAYILKGVNDGQPPASIEERLRHWHVPGVSVAVVNNGAIEWAKGYGVTEAGGRVVDTETIFQTASIGKMVTAVTVLALVDRGLFDLDRDVNEYLTSWQLPESEAAGGEIVSLERILNHSAGLTVHGFAGYTPGQPLPTLKQMLEGEAPCNSGAVTIGWKPGTEWRYSGGGYLVVQQAIADVTGRPFSGVVEELVLDPHGMTRTLYRSQLSEELLKNAAMGHQADGSIIAGRYRAMPEYGAGGGLWSTPSDLAKLGISIMRAWTGSEGEPITTGSARNMLTARLGGYGLGVMVNGHDERFTFSHGGDNTGFHTYLVVFPALGCGAAIMTNGDGGRFLFVEILRAIAEAYEWPDFRPAHHTVVTVDSAHLERLAGQYEITGFGRLPLAAADGALVVPDVLGGGDAIRLYPVAFDTFVDPVYGCAFTFEPETMAGILRAEVTLGVYRTSAIKVE